MLQVTCLDLIISVLAWDAFHHSTYPYAPVLSGPDLIWWEAR